MASAVAEMFADNGAGLPSAGDLVAIDCEFVALSKEEAEVMSDGRRVVRKEARLSLGLLVVDKTPAAAHAPHVGAWVLSVGGTTVCCRGTPVNAVTGAWPCHWKMTPGRISMLDGREPHGPGTNIGGVPFIDDYIINSEKVADHLTKFSGLHPGDLDPAMSRHAGGVRPQRHPPLIARHCLPAACCGCCVIVVA